MSDASLFFLAISLILCVILHANGKRVVAAEKDGQRWALRCRHATARANRRGRELRARDVSGRKKNAAEALRREAQQEAPGRTWNDLEAILVSSR
jgi:cytochrome c biogenesis protein ResB